MKIFRWLSDNMLLVITLFLLAFIPLYPKLPILDIAHTWVYIRIEDFLVAAAILAFFIQFIRKKATIKTPLTIPILSFWLIGLISTVFAIIFIFPTLAADAYPNIAVLHYVRRIEYLSVFFIAFAAMRDKRFLSYSIVVLTVTLLLVVGYGAGQRIFPDNFHAYLTMNEEFAKGTPLRLSALARIPSTFAGHYDLAAYLVLLIPIMGSLVFGFRNLLIKLAFFLTAVSGLVLLLMTASRVSFAVYLMAIIFMLILQKKKIFIIPVIVGSILLLNSFQGISQRFSSTISQVDLVVDARTGKAIGIATPADNETKKDKEKKPIVIQETQSTGENLPQGTGYINLPSAPKQRTITEVTYLRSQIKAGTTSAQVTNIEGDFVIKKVLAYDVSFTTRFQGEWPRAIEAFKRNIILGSGYSSISLATDNNYLRILGEVGLLGFFSFLLIFIIFSIYVYRVLPQVDSVVRSFVLGVVAGVFGLGLNAILIDVFEASKVAFVLWILLGITLGTLHLYKKVKINYLKELRAILLSFPVIIMYFLILSFGIYSFMLNNYFVGDDFTWLRWAADCKKVLYQSGLIQCEPLKSTITHYFTDSDGFFYRPGTKIYFYTMYSFFWLNNAPYHIASLFFHFVNTALVFLLAYKILKNKLFAFLTGLIFLVFSGNSESVFWISATGHLVTAASILLGLLLFIQWRESRNILFFVGSVLSLIIAPLFHEFGIVGPVLIILYSLITEGISLRGVIGRWYYILYGAIIPLYLWVRYTAQSHWLSGDYSYRLSNLVYNAFGNLVGYIGLAFYGVETVALHNTFRTFAKDHKTGILIAIVVGAMLLFALGFVLFRTLTKEWKAKTLIAGILIVIPLLPFLGLGNISPRYLYLSSAGMAILFVMVLIALYHLFSRKSKTLALGILVTLYVALLFFHISELKRINTHWQHAGEITSNVLKDFNDQFQTTKATPPNPVFYFVNIPIRYQQAWVFPVGLKDAMWFTFQNENLTVHTDVPLDAALDAMEASASARVFEFDREGNVSAVIRTKQEVVVPQ